MKEKRFCFETPVPNYDMLRIEGVVYQDEIKGFDIDEVTFNGVNILSVLNWLGDGSVNEIDKIYNATASHCEYVRQTWNEQADITTDVNQDKREAA